MKTKKLYHISAVPNIKILKPKQITEIRRAEDELQDAPCVCFASSIEECLHLRGIFDHILYVYSVEYVPENFKKIRASSYDRYDEYRYYKPIKCEFVGSLDIEKIKSDIWYEHEYEVHFLCHMKNRYIIGCYDNDTNDLIYNKITKKEYDFILGEEYHEKMCKTL